MAREGTREFGDPSTPHRRRVQHLVRRAIEDPVLAASLRRGVLDRHRDRLQSIVERGVAAGQIRPNLDAATLLHLLCGPLLCRSLIAAPRTENRDPAEFAQAIVEMVWPGIRAMSPGALQ